MPGLQINTNDLRKLSPATIARRYHAAELIQIIMNLGYDPVEGATKKRLAQQIWDLLNKPPGQVILEVGAKRLNQMSAKAIAANYPDEDLYAAAKELGFVLPEGAREINAAEAVKIWADETVGK